LGIWNVRNVRRQLPDLLSDSYAKENDQVDLRYAICNCHGWVRSDEPRVVVRCEPLQYNLRVVMPRLAAIVRIDLHVIVGEITGIDGGAGGAAAECDADANLGLLHDGGAVFFVVGGRPSASFGNQNLRLAAAQPDADWPHIESIKLGVADRGQDAAEVGIGSEESGLDQRRRKRS